MNSLKKLLGRDKIYKYFITNNVGNTPETFKKLQKNRKELIGYANKYIPGFKYDPKGKDIVAQVDAYLAISKKL